MAEHMTARSSNWFVTDVLCAQTAAKNRDVPGNSACILRTLDVAVDTVIAVSTC